MMDLAGIAAGSTTLEMGEFSLSHLVEGCILMFCRKAADHNVTLGFSVREDADAVVADEKRIRQVILNLLSNAMKFTADGGSVRVNARRADTGNASFHEGMEQLQGLPPRDFIEVSVEHTAAGISAGDQKKLFHRLKQVDAVSAGKPAGRGRGLYLCRRLVELHGGRIWVEIEQGRRSIFAFVIPASTFGAKA